MKKGMTDRKWMDFARWCEERGLTAFPAHPWTVAAFARWCEGRRSAKSITGSVQTIARVHLLNSRHPPDRDPIVVRTLRGIAIRQMTTSSNGGALFRARDFADPSETQEEAVPDEGEEIVEEEERPIRKGLRMRPRLVTRRPG